MATITRQVRDIHQAFHYRQVDALKVMLAETPTLVDAVDAGGRTLLHRAVWWGEADLVTLLLGHGARADIANASGSTATNIAWDVSSNNAQGQQVLRLLAAHGANAFLPARQFGCLANLAIQQNDADLVRAIFTGNPDQVNRACCKDKYPLHLAVAEGHTEIVRVLCQECGADPDIRSEHGSTTLHYVQKHTPLDLVRVLLASGANVNAVSKYGISPLHKAIYNDCSLDVARLLIAAGATVDAYSRLYLTPLHFATRKQNGEFIAFLLEAGADIDARGTPCDTPLMYAACVGTSASVRLLLDGGANAQAQDENGNTVLHRAAAHGDKEVVTLLLDAGADPDAANHVGISPIELAAWFCQTEVSHLLAARSRRDLRQLAQRGGYHLEVYLNREREADWECLQQQGYDLWEQTSSLRLVYAEEKAAQALASA